MNVHCEICGGRGIAVTDKGPFEDAPCSKCRSTGLLPGLHRAIVMLKELMVSREIRFGINSTFTRSELEELLAVWQEDVVPYQDAWDDAVDKLRQPAQDVLTAADNMVPCTVTSNYPNATTELLEALEALRTALR